MPLANTFGVTVDELLRGERIAAECAAEAPYPAVPVPAPAAPALQGVKGKSDPYAALESFKEISERKFRCILVDLTVGRKVESILFDPSVTAAGSGEKQIREVSLVDWSILNKTIVYRAYYTDGSYFLGETDGTFVSADDGAGMTVTASWTDQFGNACSVPLDEE